MVDFRLAAGSALMVDLTAPLSLAEGHLAKLLIVIDPQQNLVVKRSDKTVRLSDYGLDQLHPRDPNFRTAVNSILNDVQNHDRIGNTVGWHVDLQAVGDQVIGGGYVFKHPPNIMIFAAHSFLWKDANQKLRPQLKKLRLAIEAAGYDFIDVLE